jgi:hypothetical protein
MRGTLAAFAKGISHLDIYDKRTLLFGARGLPNEYDGLVRLECASSATCGICNAIGTKEVSKVRMVGMTVEVMRKTTELRTGIQLS